MATNQSNVTIFQNFLTRNSNICKTLSTAEIIAISSDQSCNFLRKILLCSYALAAQLCEFASYSCFKERSNKYRSLDILKKIINKCLTMKDLTIQFPASLIVATSSDSFSIFRSKTFVKQNQFSNTNTEVCNEVVITKFEKQNVKVHLALTHLFLFLVLLSLTLNVYCNFLESTLIQLVFIGDQLVNSTLVVLGKPKKYGHLIRPIVLQICPPINYKSFAIFRVRKKQGRFKNYYFSPSTILF